METPLTPTLLLIVDGWGQAPAGPGNAVAQAHMPVLNALLEHPSRTTLACSGRAVGLPQGLMGNSEVGHLNIGAGRVVYQDITRIDLAIENGTFATTPAIAETIAAAQAAGTTLHLIGLVSDGGVHSQFTHILALIEAAKAAGVRTAIHAITDGRDTGTHAGLDFLRTLQAHCTDTVRIASVIGRYYALDRDSRWDRVQLAWDALVHGKGTRTKDPLAALEAAYTTGKTDEFISPLLVEDASGALSLLADNDALFFFNFRADRARELCRCLCEPEFSGFARGAVPQLAAFATMTMYEASFPMPVAFPREDVAQPLGAVLAEAGYRQLRIAETEKYAHVTYFFNGGFEAPFTGEDRVLIPSPRDVATYDLKPEMSVAALTEKLIAAWETGAYDFVVCNLANLDMVGHTGNIPAVITACEVVDACVGRILEAVKKRGGRLFITADHGNAEEMLTPDGQPQTAHSKNPVALIMVDKEAPRPLRGGGKLGDIGPTILHAWGITPPAVMTGQSLLEGV